MEENIREKKEEGSVLIVALIMLVLLTLIGITANQTSEVEMQVSANERRYKENLYFAEAVAMECAQVMTNTDELSGLNWLHAQGSVTKDDIRINDSTDADYKWGTNSQQSAVLTNTRYLVVQEEVEGSLDMTKASVYSYTIYGRTYDSTKPQKGRSIVRVGFRKAF
jgi:Tfp pilus assembly protein PilX